MNDRIHGHEVLEMMMHSGKAYTRDGLIGEIEERFGGDTRFFTCSAEDLTAAGLVAFLEERGKFVPLDKGFTVDPSRVCSG